MLDSSTSVGPANWAKELHFVVRLLDPLTIGAQHVRVALITYNTEATLHFGFDKHLTKAALIKAIEAVKFSEGITATGDALKLARLKLLPHVRPGVAKLLILVTDGKTNFGANPVVEAGKLKALAVHLTTVGITSEIDK